MISEYFILEYLRSFFTTFPVCKANSQVGTKISPLIPAISEGYFSLEIIGAKYDKVLPEPVLAQTMQSYS